MKIKQLIPTILLALSIFTGFGALISRPVGVMAQGAPDWDKSSMKFEGSCTLSCNSVLEAVICNDGTGDMSDTVPWQLYYAESGDPKSGVVIETGEVPALPATDPNSCFTISYTVTQPGNYMFRAEQMTGHPGTGVLWSSQCGSNCQTETPTPTPSTEPTPTPTVDPSPTPTVTPTPTATPQSSATPTATPQSSATPTPTPTPTPSSSGNSGTGGSNSSESSSSTTTTTTTSSGQVLGASTLASTGSADMLLASLAMSLGVMMTAAGSVAVARTK